MIKSLLLFLGMLFAVSSSAFASDSSLVVQTTGGKQDSISVGSLQNENNLLNKMVVKPKQSIGQVEREKIKLIEQNKVLKKALAEVKKRVVKLKQSIQQVEREKRKLIEQNKVLKKDLAEAQHHWWNWFSWIGFFETIAGIWLAFFLFAFIRKKFFS